MITLLFLNVHLFVVNSANFRDRHRGSKNESREEEKNKKAESMRGRETWRWRTTTNIERSLNASAFPRAPLIRFGGGEWPRSRIKESAI